VTIATTAGSDTDADANPAFSGSSVAAALDEAPFDAEPVAEGTDELETPVSCALEPKPSPQRETIDWAAGSSAMDALAATAWR
jgi:hypothetical protein